MRKMTLKSLVARNKLISKSDPASMHIINCFLLCIFFTHFYPHLLQLIIRFSVFEEEYL